MTTPEIDDAKLREILFTELDGWSDATHRTGNSSTCHFNAAIAAMRQAVATALEARAVNASENFDAEVQRALDDAGEQFPPDPYAPTYSVKALRHAFRVIRATALQSQAAEIERLRAIIEVNLLNIEDTVRGSLSTGFYHGPETLKDYKAYEERVRYAAKQIRAALHTPQKE